MNRRHCRLKLKRLEDRAVPAFAAVGPEFRVNTYTTNAQRFPAVASDADGDSVVVWTSDNQDGSGYGVADADAGRARRLGDTDGARHG